MTDAYYELVDADDPRGERFSASDHVISTRGVESTGTLFDEQGPAAAIQQAQLVRAGVDGKET